LVPKVYIKVPKLYIRTVLKGTLSVITFVHLWCTTALLWWSTHINQAML